MDQISEKLQRLTAEQYGESHRAHTLEIYKLYVEMADRISARRQSANSWMLAVNTAIVAAAGYVRLAPEQAPLLFYLLVSIAGMVICYMWYRLIRSYRGMNTGKFAVIHEIEQTLPLAVYDEEWRALGEGKDPTKYLPFTVVEARIPWVFFALHGAAVAFSLLEFGRHV